MFLYGFVYCNHTLEVHSRIRMCQKQIRKSFLPGTPFRIPVLWINSNEEINIVF
jgi:hypothetical protein